MINLVAIKKYNIVMLLFFLFLCKDSGDALFTVQSASNFLSSNEMMHIQGGISSSVGACNVVLASGCNFCFPMYVGECRGYLGYCKLDVYDAACYCNPNDTIWQLACQ